MLCAGLLATVALSATALAATGGLTRFLVRSGEMPGFVVAQRRTGMNLSTYLKGDPNAKADAKRLKSAGFVTAAEEALSGPKNAQGGSAVIQVRSGSAARVLAATDVAKARQQGAGTYTALTVPGVPGARGYAFTGSAKNGGARNRDTNVYWVQGRCELFVADLRPGTGALASPVIAAVKAVHRRTGNACP